MNEYEFLSLFYFVIVYLISLFNRKISYVFAFLSLGFVFLNISTIFLIYSLISSILILYLSHSPKNNNLELEKAIKENQKIEEEFIKLKNNAEKLANEFRKTEIIYSLFNMLSKAVDINSLKSIEKYAENYTSSPSSLYLKNENFIKIYGGPEINEFKNGIIRNGNILSIGIDNDELYAVFVFKLENPDTYNLAQEFVYEIKNLVKRIYLFNRIESLSQKDGLTKLYRRSVFNEKLNEEFIKAKNFKYTLGLMMMDIDHFKNINDTYGHQAGDEVLKNVAQIIKECVYETDFVARYGGEEFVIIMPRAEKNGSLRKAEYIRERIEKTKIKIGMIELKVTISIGVAYYPTDAQTPKDLIEKADIALYYSKENGRNRVTDYSQIKID